MSLHLISGMALSLRGVVPRDTVTLVDTIKFCHETRLSLKTVASGI